MNESPCEKCPFCESGSTHIFCSRVYKNRTWFLAHCKNCGLYFTSPHPTDEDLASIYSGDYHAHLRTEGGTETAFGAKYKRYADTLARYLPSGHVVDVGCSTGLLVRILRDRGYEAVGVELNITSAQWGREHYRIPIHTQPLERCPFPEGSLDAMLFTDVLEHMHNPRDFLRDAGRLLSPKGIVLVAFPDLWSLESRYQYILSKIFRRPGLWWTCHIPGHIWEFTQATAEVCFESAGFRILEFRRIQPPPDSRRAFALRLLASPVWLLRIPPFNRLFGTHMEFVLQKI